MSNASTIELENSLLKKLVAENDEDQKEIRVLEKRVKERDPLIKALKSKLGVGAPSGGTSYAGMIKDAIRAMTSPRFTQKDIEDETQRANPGTEIDSERTKSVLWNLQNKKQLIKQVQKGNNRGVVAVFEKLPSANGESNGHQGNEDNRLAYGIAGNNGAVTVGEFEQFIREKNRRLNEVTAHFKVDERIILQFMSEPSSKVYRGEKGWLKIRD